VTEYHVLYNCRGNKEGGYIYSDYTRETHTRGEREIQGRNVTHRDGMYHTHTETITQRETKTETQRQSHKERQRQRQSHTVLW